MQVLLPGEDIKFSSPADVGGSYEMFQYRTLLAISAALGVPYTNVTGDLKAANYSSIRAGTVEFRRRLNQFQEMTMIYQLCRPVWRRWLETAVLVGALRLAEWGVILKNSPLNHPSMNASDFKCSAGSSPVQEFKSLRF